ncbi:MBOAT family O-acyltransferase [Crateriforma spongiae]|uniref:MBOAT family O-acyltransferase n=1 Tax=Crateriforma spongiae TaxID=2724528 RepID=UPI001445BE78|nr:MBOAT family protein [Crateriforma spongiae]
MGFTRLEFPIFLALVIALVWATRRVTLRNAILLAASYYFYAYWDYRFCGLLILSTVVDFIAARQIDRSQSQGIRRLFLLTSLCVNLGVLGFFKYYNFFIESLAEVWGHWGWGSQTLQIILPVGISFYTFQTLSYTIDVYRRKLRATSNFLNFALYVAFFPQLVAGPIVRAKELLPQLAVRPTFSKRRMYGGFQQLLRGAVKKILIADRMGEAVDVVFAGPDLYSTVTLWIAVVAYAGQIYYDFLGYTDMATGAAKMMGYRFPPNFRHPYLSSNMAQFWRRWHMTLSRWLRDYLYIPLGGNRLGRSRTYVNLMITMTLGGLWHGAAWTFVLWGIWHGLGLAVHRMSTTRIRLSRGVGWGLTTMVVLAGWVLFRSPDLASAMSILGRMSWPTEGIYWFPPLPLLMIGVMVIEHACWAAGWRRPRRLPADRWYSPVVTAILLWSLVLYAPQGFRPFVYFQF